MRAASLRAGQMIDAEPIERVFYFDMDNMQPIEERMCAFEFAILEADPRPLAFGYVELTTTQGTYEVPDDFDVPEQHQAMNEYRGHYATAERKD